MSSSPPFALSQTGRCSGIAMAIGVCACSGEQSALAPAGTGASQLADLFWGMVIGAGIIWFVVTGLALHAASNKRKQLSPRGRRWLVIGGGVVFPFIILTGLLIYGLSLIPVLLAQAPEGALQIHVTAHQYWWRIHYPKERDVVVTTANEIHLPVGRPVEFHLDSADVIHSFWIPSLGGKMDMIPGRKTRLLLEPVQVGVYRGVCAEYCGTSHALMSFFVVVESEHDFERWLTKQSEPALVPSEPVPARGKALFVASGCGGCHTVRGTAANGVVGPDLTHVGSRRSIGASLLTTDAEAFTGFIARTNELKPGVHMPSFGMLPTDELRAVASYLRGLK